MQKKSAGKPAFLLCCATGKQSLKLAATLAIPGETLPSTPLTSHHQSSNNSPLAPSPALLRLSMALQENPEEDCLSFLLEGIRPLSGEESLLLANTNKLLSTSPLQAMVLGGCCDRAPASLVPA